MLTANPDDGERISAREFARRAGCHDTQVRRAIALGRLVRDDDGRLDAAQIDSEWRRTSKRAKAGARGYSAPPLRLRPSPTLAEAADAFVACLDHSSFDRFLTDMLAGKLASLPEALRIKENALALKHLLGARVEAKKLARLALLDITPQDVAGPRLEPR